MPFDDPIRLRVMKAISASLAEITIANGYKHDLKDIAPGKPRVFRGRLVFGTNDPLPMVSILEPPIPTEQEVSGRENPMTHGPWEIIIQGFVEDDFLNPTDPAHVLLADVKKRLAQEKVRMQRDPDHRLFGIREISDIQLGPGVVRPPDEASSKAYFWLSIEIGLAEDSANPYD